MLTFGLCFSLEIPITVFLNPPSQCTARGPLWSLSWLVLTILALNCLCLVWVSLLTTYWSSVVATTTYLCWLCRSPLLDKEGYFVCLLAMGFSTRYSVCALSLSLMACTWWFQLILTSFGWHVVLVGHFPQKSLSKDPRIGFFPFPHHQTMPSDLWPTTSYIGWVQAGGAWVSHVLHLLHLLLMHLSWSRNWFCTFYRALLVFYGVGCFLICNSLWLTSFGDWASLDHRPSFPRLILCSLRGLVSIFLLYHSAIPVVMLLDSFLL